MSDEGVSNLESRAMMIFSELFSLPHFLWAQREEVKVGEVDISGQRCLSICWKVGQTLSFYTEKVNVKRCQDK